MIAMFNYHGDPAAIRLMGVSSHDDLHRQDIAKKVIAHAARAVLQVGGNKIYLHPAMVGSYAWLRCGALQKNGPSLIRKIPAL